jgi:hypothetical protein
VKKTVWILAVVLLALPVMVVPVLAETAAIKETFSATATILGTLDPGTSWTTEDGVMQIKKMGQIGEISGEIDGTTFDGTIWLVISLTNDLTTMDGSGHGKFEISTADGTIKGMLRVVVDFETGYALGTLIAPGICPGGVLNANVGLISITTRSG